MLAASPPISDLPLLGRRAPYPSPRLAGRGSRSSRLVWCHAVRVQAAATVRLRLHEAAATMGDMSLYALQKLIRDVNRKPACREAFFQSAEKFAAGYDLARPEREALIKRDRR